MGIAVMASGELDQAEKFANRSGALPPPLLRYKSDEPFYPKYYLDSASRWADTVYEESVNQLSYDEETAQATRYIQLIMGKQWPAERPNYKSRPVINKISKFFWELVAYLTDLRLNIDVSTENDEYKKLTELFKKTVQWNYRNERGTMATIFAIMHASLGSGYIKVYPNNVKNDICYLPCGPDSVTPIMANPIDLQLSAGIIHQAWMPLTWFQEKFPNSGHSVQAEMSYEGESMGERPGYVPEYTWNAIAPGLRKFLYSVSQPETRGGGGWGTGKMPVALYTEFWFRDPQINTSRQDIKIGSGNWSYTVLPGERIYPWGRLLCTAQKTRRKPLYDGPNFHWHGQFPFALLRLQPVPWMWSGISEFRDLWPINSSLNQVVADGLDLQKQCLNPTFAVKDGAIDEATWAKYFPGMPGQKIRMLLRNETIDQQMKWIYPDMGILNSVPQMYQLLKGAFDEQSGIIDIGKLSSKKQVPSESTVESIRESQQGKFRVKGLFLEQFIEDVGRLALSDIIQFYTRKRVIQMFGSKGLEWEHLDYDPDTIVPYIQNQKGSVDPYFRGRDFVKQFILSVAAGSGMPAQRRANAEIAMALRRGRDIDRKSLIHALQEAGYNLPPAEVIDLRLREEFSPPPPKKGGKGAGAQVPAPA
jgi:hypothetical protein